jgi:sigma-E factor negative regulatory protein RseA
MNSPTSHQEPSHAAHLSALLDGELSSESLDALLAQWPLDPALADDWDALHVVSLGLKGQEAVVSAVSTAAFLSTLRPGLQSSVHQRGGADSVAKADRELPWWHRYGAAVSVVGAVLLGWRLVLPLAEPSLAVAQLEPVELAPPVVSSTSDTQLDALLAAHQQLGGSHTLQPSSGFFRQAVYVVSAR